MKILPISSISSVKEVVIDMLIVSVVTGFSISSVSTFSSVGWNIQNINSFAWKLSSLISRLGCDEKFEDSFTFNCGGNLIDITTLILFREFFVAFVWCRDGNPRSRRILITNSYWQACWAWRHYKKCNPYKYLICRNNILLWFGYKWGFITV